MTSMESRLWKWELSPGQVPVPRGKSNPWPFFSIHRAPGVWVDGQTDGRTDRPEVPPLLPGDNSTDGGSAIAVI